MSTSGAAPIEVSRPRPLATSPPKWLLAGLISLDRPLLLHEQHVFEALARELATSRQLAGLIEIADTRVLVVYQGSGPGVRAGWNLLKCHPRVEQTVVIADHGIERPVFTRFDALRPQADGGAGSADPHAADAEQLAQVLRQAAMRLQVDGHPALAGIVRNFIDWEAPRRAAA